MRRVRIHGSHSGRETAPIAPVNIHKYITKHQVHPPMQLPNPEKTTQARMIPSTEVWYEPAKEKQRRKNRWVRGPKLPEWGEGEGPPCRCKDRYTCVRHLESCEVDANHTTATTSAVPRAANQRPVERLRIDRTRGEQELQEWADSKGIVLGTCIPPDQKLDVLQTLWTYRDLESTGLDTLGPPTDLITHRMRIKEGTPIYKAKARMMSRDKEWWYRKFAIAGMESGMFERPPGIRSQWGADPVLVKKPGKKEPRLTFNYHYVWEEPPGNQMQLSREAHGFLSLPTHAVFSQFDLKNGYWAVEIHPDDRHYLAFSVPGIGQLQPTRMAQGARSSSFTMNELGNIAFGGLPGPPIEPSFLHNPRGPEYHPDMTFYIDDLFPAHSSWSEHWTFLQHHFLPRLRWARLRLSMDKMKIGVHEMLALGEIHRVGGTVAIKPERVKKILEWPVPQNQTDVRGFLGTAIMARQWIRNYAELARPLTRLTGTQEWTWGDAEELAFTVIKNKAATATLLHGWDPGLPVEVYVDASKFAAGCFIRQKQGDRWVPILYDSFAFTPTERNYDTYKRELKAMVVFAEKHAHMLNGPQTSTIKTDHKPLTGFLKGNNHEDIFFRWLERLRPMNITIEHIAGIRNTAADGLSRTIFPGDCEFGETATQLLEQARLHDNDAEREWFWKSGKGGYEEMLRELCRKDDETKKQEVIAEVRMAHGESWDEQEEEQEENRSHRGRRMHTRTCYECGKTTTNDRWFRPQVLDGEKKWKCNLCYMRARRASGVEQKPAVTQTCGDCGIERTLKRWTRKGEDGKPQCEGCAKRKASETRTCYECRKTKTCLWTQPREDGEMKCAPCASATRRAYLCRQCLRAKLARKWHDLEEDRTVICDTCHNLGMNGNLPALDEALMEVERIDNIPTGGFATSAGTTCPSRHSQCDKSSCVHFCCRRKYLDCDTQHSKCNVRTCNHPCCKMWTRFVIDSATMGPPHPKFLTTKRTRRKNRDKNLELLEKHHQRLIETIRADQDRGNAIDILYDIKNTVHELMGGEKFMIHKDKPQVTLPRMGWTMPSITPSDGRPGSGTVAPFEASPTQENLDPQLRMSRPLAYQEASSVVDDSADQPGEATPSEYSDLPVYSTRPELVFSTQFTAKDQQSQWDNLEEEWYGDVRRLVKDKVYPSDWGRQQRHKLSRYAEFFRWESSLDRLERRTPSGVWVPCAHPRRVPEILQQVHDRAGHFNSEVVTKNLRHRVWWPALIPDVIEYTRTCTPCAMWAANSRTDSLEALDALNPFELLQADLLGPWPTSRRGNKYLLVMACCFSGFTITRPIPDKTAPIVREAIENGFDTFGNPMVLYTDPGSEFVDKNLRPSLAKRGVYLAFAPAAAHRATGAVERTNRILRACIQKQSPIYVNASGEKFADADAWDIAAQQATQSANERYVPTMGCSPSEIVLGSLPGKLMDLELAYPTARRAQLQSLADRSSPRDIPEGDLRQACFQLIAERAEKREHIGGLRVHDRRKREEKWEKTVKPQRVKIGSTVLVCLEGSIPNQIVPWQGPYRVKAFTGEHNKTVELVAMGTGKVLRYNRHVGKLKVLHRRPARLRLAINEEEATAVEGDLPTVRE